MTQYSIKTVCDLLKKTFKYIPIEDKPFRCDIEGRWEIILSHDSSETVTVKIYKDDGNWSEYFVVDEGEYWTTYPELERKRFKSGRIFKITR